MHKQFKMQNEVLKKSETYVERRHEDERQYLEQMAKKDKLIDEQKELIKELNAELDNMFKDQSNQRDMLYRLRDRVNTNKS